MHQLCDAQTDQTDQIEQSALQGQTDQKGQTDQSAKLMV
jgi:hypothetical protein